MPKTPNILKKEVPRNIPKVTKVIIYSYINTSMKKVDLVYLIQSI